MLEHDKQWYAVYTKPQKEKLAELNLRLRGIDTFFPKLFLPKAAKRKKQVVSLFPSYLFVRVKFLSEELEESLMVFLMRQAGPDGIISARCNLKVGQQVSLDGGPFDGLVGIIEEPPDAKGRVRVLLEFLKRPIKVEVPVQFIKAGWIPSALLREI